MASRPRVHPPIGQVVTTPDGRRLGRVIAIIHHGAGADVLAEDRRWFRRRTLRISGDQLNHGPEHTLVCHAAPIAAGISLHPNPSSDLTRKCSHKVKRA